MRIDLVLKYLCLVKSRSAAKHLCDDSRVLVDGRPVRASARVAPSSRITIRFSRRSITLVLGDLPRKQLSKTVAVDYYRLVDTPSELQARDDDATAIEEGPLDE
jgi:ribosomal 50S subunit-recycling heat shock protein